MKLSQGDSVIIIAGKDKGKKGTIMRVLRDENRLVVSGINLVTKYKKKTPESAGQMIKLEHSIHASNVMMLDPKSGKGTRLGWKKDEKTGHKVRFSKKSGTTVERSKAAPEAQDAAKTAAGSPFWKKGGKGSATTGDGKTKADAGPAQSTTMHTRSAGRGS